jgi:DNA-3-methyladenine glycosylase II
MAILQDETDVARGAAELARSCPHMAMIVETCGIPPLRWREPGFGGLVSTITAQQLSTSSANAIRTKLRAVADPITPEALLALSDDALRACGYSAPKIRTLRAIAGAIVSGELPFAALAEMPPDEAHAAMVKIHGIGPWTAEVWMMFCLGTQDIFAPGDLALQEGARLAMALETRPTTREMAKIAERWSPWRAVAARLLWAYYGAMKKRAGVVSS